MNNMKQKILSLLVLLLTAATGAWADVDLTNKVWQPGETFNIGGKWFYRDNSAPRTKFLATNADGTVPDFVFSSNLWYLENIISASNAVGQHSGTVYFSNPLPLSFVMPEGKTSSNKPMGFKIASGDGTQDSPYMFGLVYPDVEVTTNKATGATTFTEAEFTMPDFDATAEFDIVRDLAQQTKVNVIIGTGDDAVTATADTRLRIAKSNNVYVPVSALSCSFTDQIENKTIAKDGFTDAKLTPQFYLQGENDTWTLVTDINTTTKLPNNLQPGQVYCITLKAADGSYYDGETPQSFTVTLFEGYEVVVPAGEFVTYYKDEPLYADPVTSADAQLYTISSVSGDQATLSSAIATAPSNTPLLVYNSNTSEDKTFLLIPADAEPNLSLTVYPGFTGTLTATTIPASTTTQNNYALNGKQFVWVKNALAIAANKCWLSVTTGGILSAPALNIVFGETTGISTTNFTNYTNDAWYDLNGRKIANGQQPTAKGIYIHNGKKVVK